MMIKRMLRIIEVITLFICTYIGVYSIKRLPAAYFDQWSPIPLSLYLTIILVFISFTLGYRRIAYIGALLFIPVTLGESVIGWGIEYNYVKKEFVWSIHRMTDIPRVVHYNLEPFITTMSPLEMLLLAMTLTTAYIILDIVTSIQSQSNEMERRGGTPTEVNTILVKQLILQSRQISKTVLITGLIIIASNYMNSNIYRITGIFNIIPGFLGILLLIVMLWSCMKQKDK